MRAAGGTCGRGRRGAPSGAAPRPAARRARPGARIGACRGQPRAADAAYWLCGGEGEGEEGVAVGEAGGALLRADADAWERVDDVVMGGVSSSRVWADEARGALVWAGVCRAEGARGPGPSSCRPTTASKGSPGLWATRLEKLLAA